MSRTSSNTSAPRQPVITPQMSRESTQMDSPFTLSDPIEDFILFPEEDNAEMILPELDNQDFDLSNFDFDIDQLISFPDMSPQTSFATMRRQSPPLSVWQSQIAHTPGMIDTRVDHHSPSDFRHLNTLLSPLQVAIQTGQTPLTSSLRSPQTGQQTHIASLRQIPQTFSPSEFHIPHTTQNIHLDITYHSAPQSLGQNFSPIQSFTPTRVSTTPSADSHTRSPQPQTRAQSTNHAGARQIPQPLTLLEPLIPHTLQTSHLEISYTTSAADSPFRRAEKSSKPTSPQPHKSPSSSLEGNRSLEPPIPIPPHLHVEDARFGFRFVAASTIVVGEAETRNSRGRKCHTPTAFAGGGRTFPTTTGTATATLLAASLLALMMACVSSIPNLAAVLIRKVDLEVRYIALYRLSTFPLLPSPLLSSPLLSSPFASFSSPFPPSSHHQPSSHPASYHNPTQLTPPHRTPTSLITSVSRQQQLS